MPRVADKRARIDLLRAAEAVFSEHGLGAAKVEDITARAGVSKGAFYLHFESKEDCFRQIVESFLARLASQVKPPPLDLLKGSQSFEEFAKERLAGSVEMLEFCWQNRALMAMILGGGGGTPYAYLIDEFGERIVQQSEVWLRQLIEVGIHRDNIDPGLVARLMSGTFERLVRELIKQTKRPDIEAWARQAHELLTRGLLSPRVGAIVDRQVTKQSPKAKRGKAKVG